MSNIIKFIRGAEASIPTLNQGEPAYATDTHKLFIGDGALNYEILMAGAPELKGEMNAGAHSIGFTMQNLTENGATLIDWRLGNHVKFTFGAQNETITFTNPTKQGHYSMIIIQDETGSRIITWSGMTIKWFGGVAPTLSTGANAEDVLGLIFDGTSWYGMLSNIFAVPA